MAMSEEARQRFEMFESLFAHPGWKLFVSDVEGWMSAIEPQWRHVLDARGLHILQGRYDGLGQCAGFEKFVANMKSVAEEEAAQLDDV